MRNSNNIFPGQIISGGSQEFSKSYNSLENVDEMGVRFSKEFS